MLIICGAIFGADDAFSAPWLHVELGAANVERGIPQVAAAYSVLFRTVDRLIAEKGPEGSIVLNDISNEGLIAAKSQIELYLRQRGFNQVSVKILPGDFMNPSFTLPTGTSSVHLKNPFESFFHDGRALNAMLNLASQSAEGLEFSTYFEAVFRSLLRTYPSQSGRLTIDHLPKDGIPYIGSDGKRILVPSRYRLFGGCANLFESSGI